MVRTGNAIIQLPSQSPSPPGYWRSSRRPASHCADSRRANSFSSVRWRGGHRQSQPGVPCAGPRGPAPRPARRGAALANRALEFSPHHPGLAADARHLLGDLAIHPDRFDAERGEAHYRDALALAEPRGMRPLVAHCHLGLGRLCQRAGRRPDAEPIRLRDDDVSRHGHDVLAGEGKYGAERSSLLSLASQRGSCFPQLLRGDAPRPRGPPGPLTSRLRQRSIAAQAARPGGKR